MTDFFNVEPWVNFVPLGMSRPSVRPHVAHNDKAYESGGPVIMDKYTYCGAIENPNNFERTACEGKPTAQLPPKYTTTCYAGRKHDTDSRERKYTPG